MLSLPRRSAAHAATTALVAAALLATPVPAAAAQDVTAPAVPAVAVGPGPTGADPSQRPTPPAPPLELEQHRENAARLSAQLVREQEALAAAAASLADQQVETRAAVEDYELALAERDAAENERQAQLLRLARARTELADQREALGRWASQVYRSGGAGLAEYRAIVSLLEASRTDDVSQRLELLERVGQHRGTVVEDYADAEREQAAATAAARAAARDAGEALAAAEDAREVATQSLAQQDAQLLQIQQLLAQTQTEAAAAQAEVVAAEVAAAEAAAAQAAAEAAAAEAAAAAQAAAEAAAAQAAAEAAAATKLAAAEVTAAELTAAQALEASLAAAQALARQQRMALKAGSNPDNQVTAAVGACAGGPVSAFSNGAIPLSALCRLETAPAHHLRADVAFAFDQMSRAYQLQTGSLLCITDSYRTLATQVSLRARKPDLAAVPGTSNHGWATAVDLCGGVETFGSPAHEWMRTNAPSFGFFHPTWAQADGSKPEPWHWEFGG